MVQSYVHTLFAVLSSRFELIQISEFRRTLEINCVVREIYAIYIFISFRKNQNSSRCKENALSFFVKLYILLYLNFRHPFHYFSITIPISLFAVYCLVNRIITIYLNVVFGIYYYNCPIPACLIRDQVLISFLKIKHLATRNLKYWICI